MATFPAPDPVQSTFLIPGSNTPGNGCLVFFYTNLTSTKTTVYKDSSTSTAWTNPIVLDSGGNLPSGGQVYINSGETLTVKYAPANDTDPPGSVYRTLNDVEGINDVSVAGITGEWVTGTTPTFISATQFSVAGNQTAIYTVGRRIKTTNTGGTIYSTITASVFGAVTTITLVNDSGVLDSGLSAVEYALLASVNASVPGVTIISGTYTFQGSSTVFRSSSVVFHGSSTVFNGHIDISASTAGQIKFPASTNPSANVNTLDDYEEGTWVPSIGGSATYIAQTGNYTKIGRSVHIDCDLQINVAGTGSPTSISGAPFAASSNTALSVGLFSGASTAVVSVYGVIGGGTQVIGLQALTAASTASGAIAIFKDATRVVLSGSYNV